MNSAHARTHAESFSVFRSILEPTCNFSLLYTVNKISSNSYPYQCLFVPSAPKGMGREKIKNGEVCHQYSNRAKQELANASANSVTIGSGSEVTEKKKYPEKIIAHHSGKQTTTTRMCHHQLLTIQILMIRQFYLWAPIFKFVLISGLCFDF